MYRLLLRLWRRPARQQQQHQVYTHVSRCVALLSLAQALAASASSAPAEQHHSHTVCALHCRGLPSLTHHQMQASSQVATPQVRQALAPPLQLQAQAPHRQALVSPQAARPAPDRPPALEPHLAHPLRAPWHSHRRLLGPMGLCLAPLLVPPAPQAALQLSWE